MSNQKVNGEAQMKTKTEQVAIVSLYGHKAIIRPWYDWMDEDEDYVRESEVVDVTFTLLADDLVVPQKVKIFDNQIAEVRATALAAVGKLEDDKSRLLAITREVVE